MAHFAELNSDNVVLRVVVIDNNDVNTNGGDLSEQAAEYVKKIVPLIGGVKWIQTSYNNNFRRNFAGISSKYIVEKDIFIGPQPYQSWSLDSNYYWQPPIVKPSDGSNGTIDQRYKEQTPDSIPCAIEWSEEIVAWTCVDKDNIIRKWIPNSQTWEVISQF